MKCSHTIVFSILCMLASTLSAWGQASTEGKDFWISSTLCVAPPPKSGSDNRVPAEIYIAVSAKKATTVTITNPHINNWQIQQNIAADTWYEFKNIPQQNWYPQNIKNTGNILPLNDNINDLGLHLTSTEDVSVYVVLRASASMDATNILPTPTLQSEYFAIDYWAEAHNNKADIISMITILATEDNTQVRIIPSNNTYNNSHTANTPYTITLQKGQVYYMLSKHLGQLTGTHIEEIHGKKIAVYCGSALTRIPTGVSARDCLFEQVMPLDYWGTEFVVTRSVEKDANIFAITGMEDGTQVTMGEGHQFTINRGETQYFELNHGQMKTYTDHVIPTSHIFVQDAIYVNSSCPIAIMSFDTGNSYTSKSNSEISNSRGDPSSVWIAPLQQRINKITFGTCHTDKTKRHYLDVVSPTASAAQTTLSSNQRTNIALTFQPVAENPAYSYARMLLVDDDKISGEDVFTLSNPDGIVAHVYGNGNDESYAYSVGSSAVKRGVKVDGKTYINGTMETETYYCVNEEVSFDAQVGSDIVDKVDWDFGDGVTENNGTPLFSHTYTSPGWYDVVARVYAHKECPETTYPAEEVQFSFYVQAPVIKKEQVEACDSIFLGGEWIKESKETTVEYDCDSIVTYYVHVGHSKKTVESYTGIDMVKVKGKKYTWSQQDTIRYSTSDGCDSLVIRDITVKKSLIGCDFAITPLGEKIIYESGEETVVIGDSTEIYVVTIYKSAETKEEYRGKDSVVVHGKKYYDTVIDTVRLKTANGCDSLVIRDVTVDYCLKMNIKGFEFRCDDNNASKNTIAIPYEIVQKRGGVYTQAKNIKIQIYNDRDSAKQDLASLKSQYGYMFLSSSIVSALAPDNYKAKLTYYDEVCEMDQEHTIDVQIYYDRTKTFDYVYTNVLAVRTPEYNGGYVFTNYQWCHSWLQDTVWVTDTIAGANQSIYHQAEDLVVGDKYFVILTREDGTQINTCPIKIWDKSGKQDAPARDNAPKKQLRGSRLIILTDEGTYNSYGHRIE